MSRMCVESVCVCVCVCMSRNFPVYNHGNKLSGHQTITNKVCVHIRSLISVYIYTYYFIYIDDTQSLVDGCVQTKRKVLETLIADDVVVTRLEYYAADSGQVQGTEIRWDKLKN